MNNSFRGAFNNFKGRSAQNFGFKNSKSFFNNKFSSSFLNYGSTSSTAFRINFGNKYFMSKMLSLNQSHAIVSMISNASIVSGMTSGLELENESCLGQSTAESMEALVMIGDVCLLREDCKWTCGTRLASGPHTPVLAIAG